MLPLRALDSFILSLISLVITSPGRKEALHQFVKFGIIGVLNTLIDFSVYTFLTRLIPFFGHYIYVAATISFLCGALFSYFANRTWTFTQKSRPEFREAVKFYISVGTAYLLTIILLYIFVNIFNFYDLYAKIIVTFIILFWNFFMNKFWVFKPKKVSAIM